MGLPDVVVVHGGCTWSEDYLRSMARYMSAMNKEKSTIPKHKTVTVAIRPRSQNNELKKSCLELLSFCILKGRIYNKFCTKKFSDRSIRQSNSGCKLVLI